MEDLDRKYDKFYTNRNLSKRLINFSFFVALSYEDFYFEDFLFLDPCAGDGAFFDYLPEPKIGIDIFPPENRKDIIKQDFLEWYPPKKSKIFIISNFPFGKNSSLALKFLNHASNFSEFIGCILPKTFDKLSIKKRINKNLVLCAKIELEKNSFFFKNNVYDVPCNFYIFKNEKNKNLDENEIILSKLNTNDFIFVKNKDEADFAFQRVGTNAGKVSLEGLNKSKSSHYFIKVLNKKIDVKKILENIDWSEIKKQNAGNPSISKKELIFLYEKYKQK